jgi:tetratricopeptide (TPR) repeat protein
MKLLSLTYISVLFLFFSCATTPKKTEKGQDELKNSDFISPSPILYNPKGDYFVEVKSEAGSLGGETLDNLPEGDLDDYEDDDENPLNQMLSYCYQKKFKQADQLFDRFYRRYIKHPGYWNQVGTCFLLRGEKRKALLYYNKAKDLYRNYIPALNNLGVIFQLEGKDQKALSVYKKASKLSPFSLTPKFNLAQLYAKYGFVNEARGIFENLLGKRKSDFDVNIGLAYVEMLSGNFPRAVQYYEKVDTDWYEKAEVGLNLTLALQYMNRKKDALNVFDDIDPPKDPKLLKYYRNVKQLISGGSK